MLPQRRYTDYASFLARHFEGKVQKLSVNAGFTCPNRDGTVGWGGCTYCNNQTFNPEYCDTQESVAAQLQRGKAFFARKYPAMRYLAYFQAYTNTYAETRTLRRLYEEALAVEGICGIVIGTRPDCMPPDLLQYLAELHCRSFVVVEYGVESVIDRTLRRINRGHTFDVAAKAIERTAAAGIPVGVHTILGLPGESREEMLRQAEVFSRLPVSLLKLHQLQIIRGTRMAREYAERPEDFGLFSPLDYALLVADFLERLSPDIAVERFTSASPRHLLVAPDWGLKNYEFTALVEKELQRRGTRQGSRLARASI